MENYPAPKLYTYGITTITTTKIYSITLKKDYRVTCRTSRVG
jgi:hypothetical protein